MHAQQFRKIFLLSIPTGSVSIIRLIWIIELIINRRLKIIHILVLGLMLVPIPIEYIAFHLCLRTSLSTYDSTKRVCLINENFHSSLFSFVDFVLITLPDNVL